MVTAIVRKVQAMLQASGRQDVAVEIVFPVASEAITTDSSARPSSAQNGNGTVVVLPGGLPVVPGPAGGEGCSAEGGCASCPYMKVSAVRQCVRQTVKHHHPVFQELFNKEGLNAWLASVLGRAVQHHLA